MTRTRSFASRIALLGLLLATAVPALAQDLKSFEAKTTVHKLKNGWTFLIVERPVAPVFSFCTQVDTGSAQEVPGITGLAHMFEHLAFKGTETLGTTNYPAEKKAIEATEAAYQALQTERLSSHPDAKKLATLEAEFRKRQQEAESYVVKNEYDEVLTKNGAIDPNAETNADDTRYYYSLPSNKLELFLYLEADRFRHPVFREFYEERDVVQEERRMRTEGEPLGRLIEQFVATAFQAHSYHHPPVGYMSDLQSLTLTDAYAFYKTHYVPENMVTVIVGDVKAATLVPLLDAYFGPIPAAPSAPPLRTVEPEQTGERIVILEDPAQPFYVEAYHKPAGTDPDQPVYDAIDDILSTGRTSRLYRSLVRDKKIAIQVGSFTGLPGDKYPNLWAVLAVPAFGATNEQVQAALRSELDRLTREDVTADELAKWKTRARASVVRSLNSNSGLAVQLAVTQRLYGDWRELFHYLDRVDKVTAQDIRRVAQRTFQKTNRTVAMIVTQSAAPAAAGR
ncbi:MAG TPA: pitrilysin family protein [Thermoanaerobaculia bacterium]